MPKPKFPSKPDAPSVRTTIGVAIARSRTLADEAPRTRQEVVRDILATLHLPPSLRNDILRHNFLDPDSSNTGQN